MLTEIISENVILSELQFAKDLTNAGAVTAVDRSYPEARAHRQ